MDHLIDDSDRLKPCPFCGAEAEIITLAGETDEPSIGAQCVQCTSSACGAASGLIYPLMDDVTDLLHERWNKRHNAGVTGAEPVGGASALTQMLGMEVAMKEKLQDGHRSEGRWILAPVADITRPKPWRICYGPRWWAVTESDEVLFFDTYGSPQCNQSQSLVERLGKGFGAPETKPRFIELAFLPHRCSDYA